LGFFTEFEEQLQKSDTKAKDTHQYMKNMGHYFLDSKQVLQCPLCAKWVQKSKMCRHGGKCFYTSKLAG
jgi:copper oxidase (laccase) domain-containing protein